MCYAVGYEFESGGLVGFGERFVGVQFGDVGEGVLGRGGLGDLGGA